MRDEAVNQAVLQAEKRAESQRIKAVEKAAKQTTINNIAKLRKIGITILEEQMQELLKDAIKKQEEESPV